MQSEAAVRTRWLFVLLLAGCDAGGHAPWGSIDGGFAGRPDSGRPGPEPEIEVRFEAPAVGRTVLYATNAAAGRVAVIRATDFSIETVGVGTAPLPAVAAPGRDLAISLDRGSSTISVLYTEADGTRVRTLPIQHEANAVAFDPTGRFAVLYEAPRPGSVRRNFHDASVLDLTDGAERLVRVVVGYGPSRVTFDPAGTRAIVVTEDGISQIDLTSLPADGLLRAPLLGFDTIDPIREIQVDEDGTLALALVGRSELRLLDLRDGSLVTADLASVAEGEADVTDIDIVAGTEALVVLGSHEVIVRVPLGPELADVETWVALDLTGHGVGALVHARGARRAVAYTTTPGVEAITLLDIENERLQRVALRKSVRAVAVSDDGRFALVLHRAIPGAGTTEEELVDAAQGYSLVDLETGFARLMLVEAEPRPDGFVLDPRSERLFLALRDDPRSIRELQVVDLATFAIDRVPLVAPPTTVGVFPDLDRAFIGQEADGGRVTFYLWETRETHTVAGFELAARIRR